MRPRGRPHGSRTARGNHSGHRAHLTGKRRSKRRHTTGPSTPSHSAALASRPATDTHAPPLDRRRHLRVRGTGRQRGCGVGASGRPPGSLHPRPRNHFDLHRVWHARHLSNLSRPYTKLNREVVSQIIGTGGGPPPVSRFTASSSRVGQRRPAACRRPRPSGESAPR